MSAKDTIQLSGFVAGSNLLRRMYSCVRWVSRLLLNPVYWVACLFPRSDNVWLFGAWFGQRYLDNPKYIFRELMGAGDLGVRAYYITKSWRLSRELRSQGVRAAHAASPFGIWLQLRCGVLIFTHSAATEFFAFLVARKVKRVQTWHGIPMKNIGYDDNRKGDERRRSRLLTGLYPFLDDRCDLVLAAGVPDKKIYESAFNVASEAVVVTGYARNDEIVRRSTPSADLVGRPWRVIYMPTLRGSAGTEFPLFTRYGFDFEKVDALLTDAAMELHIRLHPVQILSPQDIASINRTTNMHVVSQIDDMYEVIASYDALITDYSGIFFDYMLTDRPIIMAPIDLEDYRTMDRDLYYEYEAICPAPPCRTWDSVVAALLKARVTPPVYETLKRRFHAYSDARSSARAIAAICALSTMRNEESIRQLQSTRSE